MIKHNKKNSILKLNQQKILSQKILSQKIFIFVCYVLWKKKNPHSKIFFSKKTPPPLNRSHTPHTAPSNIELDNKIDIGSA